MKAIIILTPLLLCILLVGCSKEVVSLNEYQKVILDNSFYKGIPQLQAESEIEILKKNQIRSMSLVVQNDIFEPDSLTFIEFNSEGKIIRRTTKENTTAGCLSDLLRQEFIYDGSKIKRVNNYTFKYKSDSMLERWMIKDTSKLRLFDWEDYTYKGDTIIVESGWATWKFIKDENENIIQQTVLAKTNNQLVNHSYSFSGLGLIKEMKDNVVILEPRYSVYEIKDNCVLISSHWNDNEFLEELEYDSNGLLKSRIHYLNNQPKSKIIISYSYY